jgi:hypothetical protein
VIRLVAVVVVSCSVCHIRLRSPDLSGRGVVAGDRYLVLPSTSAISALLAPGRSVLAVASQL